MKVNNESLNGTTIEKSAVSHWFLIIRAFLALQHRRVSVVLVRCALVSVMLPPEPCPVFPTNLPE